MCIALFKIYGKSKENMTKVIDSEGFTRSLCKKCVNLMEIGKKRQNSIF